MLRRLFRLFKYLFLAAALLGLAAYFYPEKFLCVDSGPVSADAIVILGGGVHERPLRAAELYRQHVAPRIIITGQGDDEINRQILIQQGVPASAIQVENQSKTTRENALNTLVLLHAEHINRVILVTSWYHARRSLKTFEHYGPDILFYARPSYFGFASDEWKRTGTGKRMRLEFLKIPGYWIRFGISPF